jgi:tRNA pseudouridine synthase 10
MVDFKKEVPSIHIQINPLFIEGRYRKLIRGIPQTKWPCRKCKGKGCESCNFTGKMYLETVEELISAPALEMSKARDSKFHGAGREDIDVRMLGTGRPFVLEIKEPHRRTMDFEKLSLEINQHAAGKVEVLDLKYSVKSRKAHIKTSSPDTYKVYRALVELDDAVSEKQVEDLQLLHVINQRTPIRVSHRRADKVRIREVQNIESKILGPKTLELIIKSQGGLYIKELISGDHERTLPNVSKLLGTPALCVELDVIEVGG